MPSPRARRGSIAVAGDINLDFMARVPRFTGLGGDNLSPALELRCGGVGANTALALARWGAPVRLLGATGKDWFGRHLLARLDRGKVDVSRVQRTEAALTGLMLVVVSRGQERTFFGSRGANQRFTWCRGSRRWLRGAAALHLLGYCFLTAAAARAAAALSREARRRKLPVSLDVGMGPARMVPQAILHAARGTDILFLSREEAQVLSRKQNPARALRALEGAGVRNVVLKLGRSGCLFREGKRLRHAPAFAVRSVDSTGCGDAFTAAFLHGWVRGWPLAEAALAANAAGAAAARVMGAGENMPGRREALRVLTSQRLRGEWEAARRRLVRRLRSKRG